MIGSAVGGGETIREVEVTGLVAAEPAPPVTVIREVEVPVTVVEEIEVPVTVIREVEVEPEPGPLDDAPIGPSSVDLEDAFCEGWASRAVEYDGEAIPSTDVQQQALRVRNLCIGVDGIYDSNVFYWSGDSVVGGDILGSNREGGFGWWWCELGPCVSPFDLED